MFKECKTEQSAKRQYEIEQTFLELLTTKDYKDITVSEVCEAANVPRKAFYRYFDDKEGVLHAMIHHTLVRYGEFSAKFTSQKRTVKGEIEQFFAYWKEKEQRKLLETLDKRNLLNTLVALSLNFSSSRLLDISKFLKDEDVGIEKELFCFTIIGLMSLMISWSKDEYKRTSAEMAEITCRLLTAPIFPNLREWGIYSE